MLVILFFLPVHGLMTKKIEKAFPGGSLLVLLIKKVVKI